MRSPAAGPPIVVLGLLILVAAPLRAGGLRDLADAWLVPATDVRELLSTADSELPRWTATVAQGRLFDLAELPQLGVGVGCRWPSLACRVRWERLGQSLYREDLARVEVLVGRRWRLGGVVGVDRLALDGAEPRTVAVAEFRVQGQLGSRLGLDVWWPLTAAPSWHGRQGLRRWLRATGGGEAWVWAAVVDRQATGAPVLQAEVLLQLAPSAALGLRLEPWSGAAGLVTAWRLAGVLLRTSHLLHPDLGSTHRWSLGL